MTFLMAAPALISRIFIGDLIVSTLSQTLQGVQRGWQWRKNLLLYRGAKAKSEDSSQRNETAQKLRDHRCPTGVRAVGAQSQGGDSTLGSGVLEEEGVGGKESIPNNSPAPAQPAEGNCPADRQPLSCHGFSSP